MTSSCTFSTNPKGVIFSGDGVSERRYDIMQTIPLFLHCDTIQQAFPKIPRPKAYLCLNIDQDNTILPTTQDNKTQNSIQQNTILDDTIENEKTLDRRSIYECLRNWALQRKPFKSMKLRRRNKPGTAHQNTSEQSKSPFYSQESPW